MKDIHSHILYGIDDGAISIKESLNLIKKAIKSGYTDLILTPHFRILQGYTCNNANKKKIFDTLKQELVKNNLDINIYLGNEIAINEDLFYYLETDVITSVNNSRYLLIELPFDKEFKNLKEYIEELFNKGYKVIIVHPERYFYYKNLKVYNELIKMGVLFQGNFASLYGKWGRKAQKTLSIMLKKHMIHFLGSDIHHENESTYEKFKDLIPLLEELTNDKEMVKDLIDRNIEKVINNEDIIPYDVIDNEIFIKKLFKK